MVFGIAGNDTSSIIRASYSKSAIEEKTSGEEGTDSDAEVGPDHQVVRSVKREKKKHRSTSRVSSACKIVDLPTKVDSISGRRSVSAAELKTAETCPLNRVDLIPRRKSQSKHDVLKHCSLSLYISSIHILEASKITPGSANPYIFENPNTIPQSTKSSHEI